MASEVDICNSALNQLGASQIIARTENSKAARVVNQRYDFVRDKVSRSHPWNACVRRASLGQETDTPTYKYAYQYALPTDPYCLRVINISTGGNYEELDIAYQIEGRKLLTDESTVYLRYIARITDPNEYDALLIEALTAALAADISYAITNSVTLARELQGLYALKLSEARFADAQENFPDVIEADTFTNARL